MRKILFLFGELSDLDIDWLLAHGTKQKVSRAQKLVQENKAIEALYIVLGGSFSITAAASGSHEISHVGVGEIIGEISFVEKRLPSATVTASVDSMVFAVPHRSILRKIQEDTGFAARFYRALAVFLAYRLRNSVGKAKPAPSPEKAAASEPELEVEGELDPHLLDNVYIAGTRFDRMLKHLMSN